MIEFALLQILLMCGTHSRSDVIANKADAQWTYKGNKSYMPMVGHIAQTGQIVATDFRAGNVSPNTLILNSMTFSKP
jgi:hypothetical protein